MIDCEVKFGSYVPKVPQIYQDAAKAPDHTTTNQYEQEIQRVSDCYIGPTWTSLQLIQKEAYNHDTSLFTFALPDSTAYLNLPVTAHLLVKTKTMDQQQKNVHHHHHHHHHHVRPYTALEESQPGQFTIMVKLYREWGIPEAQQQAQHSVFLYTKTDHSYKPPGQVSTYIHALQIGGTLPFLHNQHCLGKLNYPFPQDITSITMIAVGAGIAPMIRILKALLEDNHHNNNNNNNNNNQITKIRLLYGVRTVADILQRERLDQYHNNEQQNIFQVCYCIGSRWSNIHFHAHQESSKQGPPLPQDWETLKEECRELGWVDGDKVQRRGASTANDPGHRIFVCGLPGVYHKLVGSRFDSTVQEGSELYQLGYRGHQVIKF